jgi:hypothetical protein
MSSGRSGAKSVEVAAFSHRRGKLHARPALTERSRDYHSRRCRHRGTIPLSGAEDCTACPNGYYNLEEKSSCLEVFRCGSGSYVKNVSVSTQEGRCALCPAGRTQRYSEIFALERGGIGVHPLECVDCPVGRYVDREGKVQCLDCPAGRFGNRTGLASSACTGVCPEGYHCSQSCVQPKPCPAGTACPQASMVPTPLLPGISYRFSHDKTSGLLAISESACPKGKYSGGGVLIEGVHSVGTGNLSARCWCAPTYLSHAYPSHAYPSLPSISLPLAHPPISSPPPSLSLSVPLPPPPPPPLSLSLRMYGLSFRAIFRNPRLCLLHGLQVR